jgi:nitrogen fixation protein FixH
MCVYLDVVYVFTHDASVLSVMLRMFTIILSVFSCVFASVSNTCFKCLICFQTYVAIVASGCFKTRSGIASLPHRLSAVSPHY